MFLEHLKQEKKKYSDELLHSDEKQGKREVVRDYHEVLGRRMDAGLCSMTYHQFLLLRYDAYRNAIRIEEKWRDSHNSAMCDYLAIG